MSTLISTADSTKIHVSVWGDGPPVLFAHAWALNGQMWDYQIPALTATGYRCIVADRRGHGRSDIATHGYDLDTLADDIACVLDTLDLRDVVLVGHSAGAQEIVRTVTRHGTDRVTGLVLSAPMTPCVLQRDDFPFGVAESAFEAVRTTWLDDFGTWVRDNTDAYFGDARVSDLLREKTTRMLIDTPLPVVLETHRTLTRADLRPDLAMLSLPVTVIHGTNDASAPIEATGRLTADMVAGATLVEIEGAGHGLYHGHTDRYNEELIAALRRVHACLTR